MGEKFYMHSRCCMANIIITYQDGAYGAECSKCGKSAGPFVIQGPDLGTTECQCEICKKKKALH